MKKRRWLRWLVLAFGIYILIGAGLYFFQEKIIFKPVPLPADHKFQFDQPFREINLAVNQEKNLSIVQFTVPDSTCKGVVLYFHGNLRNILRYAPVAPKFTSKNYEVWMIDYPGFGKSTGKRSEQILYDDALRLYRMARARFSPDSIIIYGRSIGSGIACQLASVRDCRHLVLETPFYSGRALAGRYFPIYPSALIKYEFPSNQYVTNVTAPVTILHGTEDNLIPLSQARKLYERVPGKKELTIIRTGGHSNLNEFDEFDRKLDSILSY